MRREAEKRRVAIVARRAAFDLRSHLKADKSYGRATFAADFEQGQFAFLYGVSQEGCPYDDVAARAAWTLGWLAAEDLSAKRVNLEPGRRSRV